MLKAVSLGEGGESIPSESLREKAQWVEERLTEHFGTRPYNPDAYDSDLMGALIATVLSQHTSDLNSGRAYQSLKKTFEGDWSRVRNAQESAIADAIRQGGLADVKARRIKNLLQDVYERTGGHTLDVLRGSSSDSEKLEFLKSFNGVGPKTAACILCFNLGQPVIPVDTHVHRVSKRIGLIGPKTSADQAHNELLALLPAENAYSFHVHLIEHGRQICHAQRPRCIDCPVKARCHFVHAENAEQLVVSKLVEKPLKSRRTVRQMH